MSENLDNSNAQPRKNGNGKKAALTGTTSLSPANGQATPETDIMGEAATDDVTNDPYANLLAEAVETPDDFGAGPAVPGVILVRKPFEGEYLRCLAVTMNIGPLVLTNFGPPSGV
jgi:hypothetical protein